MKLIVGLGNPGKEYQLTRHNVGFMVIDKLAEKLKIDSFKEDFFGCYKKIKINGEDFILYKPFTYMNNSGTGVRTIVDFFKIDIDDIVVIHDDLDLAVGFVRIRKNGSSGGHNGIKNIIANLSTEDFKRIRIGIGKDNHFDVIDYVLGRFNKEHQELIDKACDLASDSIIEWSKSTFDIVMNKFNKK